MIAYAGCSTKDEMKEKDSETRSKVNLSISFFSFSLFRENDRVERKQKTKRTSTAKFY